jgi:hypothetical protein
MAEDMVRRLVVEQRKRLIAGILGHAERSPWWERLSRAEQEELRTTVLSATRRNRRWQPERRSKLYASPLRAAVRRAAALIWIHLRDDVCRSRSRDRLCTRLAVPSMHRRYPSRP